MTEAEIQHLQRVTDLCVARGMIAEGLEMRIADLEAQTIAQARTIEQQAVIIREHQAADCIAVEAIRAQANEIALLKEKVRYAYVQIATLERKYAD